MDIDFTQRWTRNNRAEYVPLRPYFNPRDFEVAAIDDATAKRFVIERHYSRRYVAARRRFGLFEGGELVGVAVYSHPMADKVITNTFKNESARDGLELGRFVLADRCLSNSESWFIARCHKVLKREGFVGCVAFSDDVRRTNISGEVTHVGHLGGIYKVTGSAFTGRGTARILRILPDGTVFSERAISKIRKNESGADYSAKILESFGAESCPEDKPDRREWLNVWLNKLTRPQKHPGNLRYAWSFTKSIQLKSLPYPKIRFSDMQLDLFKNKN